MKWHDKLDLEEGGSLELDTIWGPVRLTLDGKRLRYERPAFDDDEDPVVKTILMESISHRLRMDFGPRYPDRPIVFKLENDLKVPRGEDAFFAMTIPLAVGVCIKRTDTVVEDILDPPRKGSYWGPPNDGLLSYESRGPIFTDPVEVCTSTDIVTAVVPIHYLNRRAEGDAVERCLVPLRELDLYRTQQGDLVFEVVRLTHGEEFYQEPQPIKRPPREMRQQVEKFLDAPNEADSLYERIKELPRLDRITDLFMNR